MEHLCIQGRRTFCSQTLAPTLQEEPFQVMFVEDSTTKGGKIMNTRERKGQDATKIPSAPAESCIQFLWLLKPISMTALTWMVKSIPNRNTIEDFAKKINEARFVRLYNSYHLLMKKLHLCLALMNLLLGIVLHSSSLVTHGGTNATLGRDVGLPRSCEGQPNVDHNSRSSSSN